MWRRRGSAGTQPELPFSATPARGPWWRRLGDGIRRRADVWAEDPLRSSGRFAQFVLRWLLRIALPVAGAAMMLHLFPYRASAGGAHFRVEGSIIRRTGLSADTTIGSWQFPNVDGLPIGVHISPQNVDVLKIAAAASQNGQAYTEQLRGDFQRQVPAILWWLGGETLLGILLGLAAAVVVNLAVRYVRREGPRAGELRHRGRQLGVALLVVVVLTGYGILSYNPRWTRESRATGTLAALQLFPGQLAQYYQNRSKFFDVIGAIAGIQSQLQQQIDRQTSSPDSFKIMFISDMHLAGTYPLIAQYASNFDVKLIVNTGDESEFGTATEMTPSYVDQLRALTSKVPMIWLAGNHDSPTTVRIMRSTPGVTVLGQKVARADGGYSVSAQQLNAYGLEIAAVPDPRVYGAAGAYGASVDRVTDPLQRQAVDDAVRNLVGPELFDIFATHEPIAAKQLVHDLPGQIRQVNSGHTHIQNKDSDVQSTSPIDLVEGSAGAGGLDHIQSGVPAPPIEFSIESVAADCQFTKIVRFQLTGPPPVTGTVAPANGQQVTASTIYLKPQQLEEGRTCSPHEGISKVEGFGTSS
jgi:predicted MPP superfamily phosphohydrolase